MKGIQGCSNKGPGLLQRGDNKKNVKRGVGSFKNLLQNHLAKFNQTWHKSSLEEGIQGCSKKGITSLQGEIIAKE
jgi:hypothetical protein